MAKLGQVLAIKVSNDDLKFLAMQKDAAVSVLNLAVRADEAQFRARSEGGLVAILEEVQRLRQSTLVLDASEWDSAPSTRLLQ